MAITRSKAIKLLTASEQRYYEASRTGVIDDHGAARLKRLVAQARNARDKARSRVHDLKRSLRGKGSRAAATSEEKAPENSQLKQKLFDEIVQRLEAALKRALARHEPNKPPRRAAAARTAERRAAKRDSRQAKRVTSKKKKSTKKTNKTSAPATSRASSPSKNDRLPPGDKKGSKKGAKKLARKSTVKARAQIENAPKGAELMRKNVQAAQLTHVAHDRSRGRRKQAKRDSR
jgi:hypothetical protein